MNMDKISVTAGKLERALQILQALTVIVLIFLLFMTGAMAMICLHNPAFLQEHLSTTVTLGALELTLKQAPGASIGQTMLYLAFLLASAAITVFLLFRGLRCLRRVLTATAEGRPFDPDNGVQLRQMAWLYLIHGIVNNLLGLASARFDLWLFPVETMMASGLFEQVEVNYRFPLSFLPVFFLLLVLSWVFTYGAELQRQSDETL